MNSKTSHFTTYHKNPYKDNHYRALWKIKTFEEPCKSSVDHARWRRSLKSLRLLKIEQINWTPDRVEIFNSYNDFIKQLEIKFNEFKELLCI